ncbi:hypothetical protein [Thioclava kandeliae]|uniref:Uncharacterized protein n=1 Tax=Thioclava kandeliae TaxID=3070818 RepID=A0ABV1SLX4_9RHOB
MKIIFSPIVRLPNADFELSSLLVGDDIISVNGIDFNLSTLDADPDTGIALDAGYIQSARQTEGEWTVTLLLPIGDNASEAERFPDPVTVASGPVPLPLPAPTDPEPDQTSAEDAG